MANRATLKIGWLGGLLLLGACEKHGTGPVEISAIGSAPQLANPNLVPLDAPSALLVESVAQGLVRFDAAGQIEPALAQRWIVSDDGLHYVFRLAGAQWSDGRKVTAEQVAARLRAANGRASRNPLKPVLAAIDEIVAMTDDVIEISLKSPRANFLQLLAQPEMAIIRGSGGSGPYRMEKAGDRVVSLKPVEEGEEGAPSAMPPALLRGERAALAVARFAEGDADLVVGGTAGDLPIARAAALPANRLVFDPAAGLLGLAFVRSDGEYADPAVRRALSMAVDRGALVAALGIAGLAPQESLVPPNVHELTAPTIPDWAATPFPERQRAAAALFQADSPPAVRVAMPEGPGYTLIFAHLRRDWRMIGVTAERVAANAPADLRLIDQVAPVNLASWYLRSFSCQTRWVCDPAADAMMERARVALVPERRTLIADADRALAAAVPFIPLTAPVRWSLVSPRLTGFRPNPFGRHPAGELIAPAP